jgi:Ammonium Transporter Family
MLCAGSVRQKNVKNILLKNLLDACGGAVGFYTFGYAIAFGGVQTGRTFVGNANFGLRDFDASKYPFFFFQYAFAASAATIVAGTVAERCAMSAYLLYSFCLTAFVYPIIVHSIWSGNGFLAAFPKDYTPFRGVGTIDFAGKLVLKKNRYKYYHDHHNLLSSLLSSSLQVVVSFDEFEQYLWAISFLFILVFLFFQRRGSGVVHLVGKSRTIFKFFHFSFCS